MNYRQVPIEKAWVSKLLVQDANHILHRDIEIEGVGKFKYPDRAKSGDITYSHTLPCTPGALVITDKCFLGVASPYAVGSGCWYLVPKEEVRSTFYKLYKRFVEPCEADYTHIVKGDNVVIKSNTTIGGQAFSYYWDDGWEFIPHTKKVIIGNNVHIGSSVCIDRGLLEDTVIGNGVKIDNLCHIAHDVHIGDHTLIIANTMIGGRTKIGKNCKIAPSTSLLNGITIGDNVTTGMHSCVIRDVEDGKLVYGVPAK